MKNIFRSIFFLLLAMAAATSVKAQPDSVLRIHSENYPEEKIFLHFDKSSYLPGETIWFKAYIIAGIAPTEISKNIYIEVADASGTVLQHITSPVSIASAKGSFTIPYTYKGSLVHIKAYTSWMLNFDTAFLYHKNITVVQQQETVAKQKPLALIGFFPEGGDLINTIECRVAFKANTAYGNPVYIKGALYNNANKLVDSFVSKHDGLGSFTITPQKGETYKAVWKDEWGTVHTSFLPVAKDEGATISLEESGSQLNVSIKRTATAPDNLKALKLVATMFKQVVYRSNAKLQSSISVNGVIPLTDMPTGVMQVTLFDANWMPVAERIFFVKNQDYELLADARIFKPNFSPKAKNTLEINMPDSLIGNMSVAITDADANASNPDNIISSMLLTNDIKGYVHKPSFYFSNDADSTKKFLDLVMLTHGWRRIKWQEVMQGKLPAITYPKDSTYLSVRGKVFGANASQLREAGFINLIVQPKDTSAKKQLLFVPLKPDGTFEQNNYIFYDTVSIFYQFNKKKDLAYNASVTFNNSLFAAPQKLVMDSAFRSPFAVDTLGLARRRQLMTYQASLDKLLQGTTLEGVTVKSKVKTRTDELEAKYVSGMFKGDGYQFDMVNDPAAQSAIDVLSYLQGRVAGLTINGSGSQATVTWRGSSTSFFVDEFQADVERVQTISVNDIAYIKVLRPPFFGATGGGAGGAIAIYTRKGGDVKSEPGKGLDNKKLAGYTVMKEFYSPNYETNPEKRSDQDVRTTLYWNPYVLTDRKNRTVLLTFFNNDISKKLRVDIQGMNMEGKLVYIEKIIQ
jgi:hypothetical protein